MLASDARRAFLGVLYGDEPRAMARRPRRASTACASSSTPARGCASAPPTARWSSRKSADPAHAPDGIRAVVRASEQRDVGRRDRRLRPLVDARAHARAERADARFGLPLGRHADRRSGCRSARVSGAGPRAGAAKAVRIDASAARASCAAVSRARRQRRRHDELRDERALAAHARTTRRTIVSPTYAGAIAVLAVGVAVADRDRLHVPCGIDDRLQQRALERQHVVPSVVVPFGKDRHDVAAREHVAASRLTRCVSRRRSRSMNSVPRAASRPTTGQRRSSALATKRTGCSAFSTKMSSHEMWLATISTLPRHAALELAVDARLDLQDRAAAARSSAGRVPRLPRADRRAGIRPASVATTLRRTCTQVRIRAGARDADARARRRPHQR